MQRWQEQGEQKLAELLRTRRSFDRMEQVWMQLATTNPLPGHQAYARQKATMYKQRSKDAQELISATGYHELLGPTSSIIARVRSDREQQARFIRDSVVEGLKVTEGR